MTGLLWLAVLAFLAGGLYGCTNSGGWTPPQAQSGDGWHLIETYREEQDSRRLPLVGIVVQSPEGASTVVLMTVQSGGGDCRIPVFHGFESHADEDVVTGRFDRVDKPGSVVDEDRCVSGGPPITFRVSIDRHPRPLPYLLKLDDNSLENPCEITCGTMSVTLEPAP